MAASRLRGQAGETLVETIMTVAIMGIAFVAILFAIGSALRLSGTHRDQADTGVALGAAAEAVKAVESEPCPVNGSTYANALSGLELPAGVGVSITAAGCDDLALQTIEIRAATSDGAAHTTSVVKRSPDG